MDIADLRTPPLLLYPVFITEPRGCHVNEFELTRGDLRRALFICYSCVSFSITFGSNKNIADTQINKRDLPVLIAASRRVLIAAWCQTCLCVVSGDKEERFQK